ncbi:ParB/RepB/Spo0J family partition protein [Desulfovibrio aminophilus]|nr:ParB/RepB/Spo0J family partition protein [Desulfovibrio aminophilus]MCM0756057.1 ParB/RepB/Spo0J family partition protein [Desulfovibrio aminophilus]
MAASTRGLGRGLDALLGGLKPEDEAAAPGEVKNIALAAITANPHQPRKEFDPRALDDLAASIKAQGVLQPVLVRPLAEPGAFELVAGERRLRASKMAGLAEIPALVREMDDRESLAIALIENLQREDLNALEEAEGYKQLLDQFGLSQEELARQIGKSRPALANSLRLLNLSPEIQKDVREGRISAGHARALLAISDPEAASGLHRRILKGNLTVRQAEEEAGLWKATGSLSLAEPEPEPEAEIEEEAAPRPRRARAKDPVLSGLQKRLAGELDAKVRLQGTPDFGKLTIAFSSRERLAELARLLGVQDPELD